MKLSIESATKKQEYILQTAFAVVSKELGLDKLDGTVCVRIVDDLGPGTHGATFNIMAPENTILMEIVGERDLAEFVACFCHELTHAKQVRLGELKVRYGKCGHCNRDHPMGLIWMGKEYDPKKIISAMKATDFMRGGDRKDYEALPWEKEAHEKMYPLALMVAPKLRK